MESFGSRHIPYAEVAWRQAARQEVQGKVVTVSDPLWGQHEIGSEPGDEIFARLHVNPEVSRLIKASLRRNDELWQIAGQRPAMDAANFRRLLGNAGLNGAARLR